MLYNSKISSRYEHLSKTGQHNIPIHPMQALSRCHQRIRRIKSYLLDTPMHPTQAGMIAIRQLLPLLNHRQRKVHGIKSFNTLDKGAREIPSATPNIKNISWLAVDEFSQNRKDFSRIGRTMTIGIDNAAIFKLCSIFRCKVFWFLKHLSP